MQIPEQDLRNILDQTDIVSVIERYVPLEKKGKEYLGVCPFHDDHSPSMRVSPDKQIYKCFSCGAGGNALRFIQNIEHISFPEAAAKAAEWIGYPLNIQKAEPDEKSVQNRDAYETLRLFTVYCSYELFSQDGLKALSYLSGRGFSKEILKEYEIGYAPEAGMVKDYLTHRISDQTMLEKTGLVQIGTNDLIPSFYNRIMIPIHDANGKPVGYTARILPPAQGPKYVNTTSTELYDKSSLIFNYHRAKDEARKAGRVILCEGAMDVLGLAKGGFKEGIACLGTALTDTQLGLIAALNVPVTLFYDQDEAGQNAVWKFAQKVQNTGIRFSIVANAPRKDPDEVFNAYGREGLEQAIEQTVSYASFAFDYLKNQYNLNNYEDKKQYARAMESIIRTTLESFEQNAAFEKLKALTGFSFTAEPLKPVWQPNRFKKGGKAAGNAAPAVIPPVVKGRLQAEKSVLWSILFHESFLKQFQEQVGFFSNPACSRLSLYILHAYKTDASLDPAILIEQIEEPDARDLLVELAEWPDYSDLLPQFFDDAVCKIKSDMLSHKIDSLTRQIRQARDLSEKIELTKTKQSLVLEKNRLKKTVQF